MRFHLTRFAAAFALILAGGCAGEYDDDDSASDDDDDDAADDDTGDDDVADDDSAAGDDDTGSSNHSPTPPEIHVEPEEPGAGDDLTCVIDVESSDLDNDPIAYAYEWLTDGISSGITGDTVLGNATTDMGEWTCVVRAYDGEDFSDEVTASVFIGPGGFRFETTLIATGGPGPGTASATYRWIMVDDIYAEVPLDLCYYTYDLTGTFPEVGIDQGDDYFTSIDEIVEFDSVTSVISTCPDSLDDVYAPVSDPLGDANLGMDWWLNPMAIISCDLVNSDPVLASTQFLDDVWGLGLSDGTFYSWCNTYGPYMQSYGYYGELEGLWVRPSDSSNGDYGLGLNYLPAPNGDIGGLGVYDAWSVMGFFHADLTNASEPTEGLEGLYAPFMLWIWSY